MKKLFLSSLVLLSVLSISAQTWTKHNPAPDESRHFVQIPNYGTVILDDFIDLLSIMSDSGDFKYEVYKSEFKIAMGVVSMLNENGKLVAKENLLLNILDDPSMAMSINSNATPKEMINCFGTKM